jgi:hypothetical protein
VAGIGLGRITPIPAVPTLGRTWADYTRSSSPCPAQEKFLGIEEKFLRAEIPDDFRGLAMDGRSTLTKLL